VRRENDGVDGIPLCVLDLHHGTCGVDGVDEAVEFGRERVAHLARTVRGFEHDRRAHEDAVGDGGDGKGMHRDDGRPALAPERDRLLQRVTRALGGIHRTENAGNGGHVEPPAVDR
jgi:hypothetical protein